MQQSEEVSQENLKLEADQSEVSDREATPEAQDAEHGEQPFITQESSAIGSHFDSNQNPEPEKQGELDSSLANNETQASPEPSLDSTAPEGPTEAHESMGADGQLSTESIDLTERNTDGAEELTQVNEKTDLPADFEFKNLSAADLETIEKIAPDIEGVDDYRSHMVSVYQDETRTPQGKFEYGIQLYHEIPEGKRADINVVDNFKAICTDQESLDKGTQIGNLPISFHDHHGLDESKPIYGIGTDKPLPDTLCRRGGEGEYNLTEPHENGSVPTKDEISVPYAENPEAVHFYKTDAACYKEAIDIISSVADDDSNLSEKTQELNSLVERMNEKYDLNNPRVDEEDLTEYAEAYHKFQDSIDTQQCRQDGNCDSKYGVCGTAAPMYIDDDPGKEKLYNGGAPQYNTPCPVELFTSIGVFREDD